MKHRPSLRRRLLAFLALPMLVLLVLNAVLTYRIALAYSNTIHDRNLADDTASFAQMLVTMPVTTELSPQARFLLEYDPDGHRYFNVDSHRYGTLSSNADFSQLQQAQDCHNVTPLLYNGHLNDQRVRLATVCVQTSRNPLDHVAVTVAETFADRRHRAQEILMITIPMMALLAVCILGMVWFGVNHGLKILDPLTRRLAGRDRELAPISTPDVPREILPLIETIDGLFGRLATMIEAQDRFVADAAHQLRTPLAGISLRVDQALAATDEKGLREALEHIRRLNLRTARVSTQLLAMARAQSIPTSMEPLLLTSLVPEWVSARVPEAIRAGVDLGYAPPAEGPLSVTANAPALQEVLDNLLDNALRYAGRGSTVTVGLSVSGDRLELYVEDDGPGVAENLLPRLGERFYRAPGAPDGGTGLGLAIAHEAVEHLHGSIEYALHPPHGLKVTIVLPMLKTN